MQADGGLGLAIESTESNSKLHTAFKEPEQHDTEDEDPDSDSDEDEEPDSDS